jgi:hypothetical protein
MREWWARLRARVLADRGWCEVCRDQPRADGSRFCGAGCERLAAEEQALGF